MEQEQLQKFIGVMLKQKLQNANQLGISTVATDEELIAATRAVDCVKDITAHLLLEDKEQLIFFGSALTAVILLAEVGRGAMIELKRLADREIKIREQLEKDTCPNNNCVLKRSHSGDCIYS